MKRKLVAALSLAMLMPFAAHAKKQETPVDPGPPPTSVEEFQRIAVPALLSGFFDPDSAQITWDRGITGGYWKPVLSKKIPGWFTCGLVNGKNRFGGYVGARRFVVVEYAGSVVFSQVGDGSTYDFVQLGCDKAIQQGVLPVAGRGSIPENSLAPNTPGLGIGFNAVPDGAYISQVKPSSPAAKAGLVPGMVISHINAVPIAGFDSPTVVKMIQGPTGSVTLTVIGKGDVAIQKQILN